MTTGPFDEIARKNCPYKPLEWHGSGSECLACKQASRLAQVAVEATREHDERCLEWMRDYTRSGPARHTLDCQSDILRRTEEKLK